MTISHINYSDQFNSWKKFWKFWNGSLCRNSSGPSPLLHVAVYWMSSSTKACAKKLSQYWQTILIMREEDCSQNLCEVFQIIKGEKVWQACAMFKLFVDFTFCVGISTDIRENVQWESNFSKVAVTKWKFQHFYSYKNLKCS